MQRASSRFHHWPKNWLIVLLFILLATIIAGYASITHVDAMKPDYNDNGNPMTVQANGQGQDIVDDQALYAHIADRMRAGDGYYHAAAEEHRTSGYPLKPFVTVRLPSLAMMHVALGATFMRILAGLLAITATYCWYRRLHRDAPIISPRIGAMLVFIGLVPLFWPKWLYTHDIWAGALIALAVATYRTKRPWPALACLFLALFIRETVLPIIMLVAAFAVWRKRWHEVAVIGIGILIFTAVMVIHAQAVAAIVRPDDIVSPGWAKAGGIATWLLFLQETSILRTVPFLTPMIVPLCLLGLLGWRHPAGLFLFCMQAGYALIFMVIGRADNFYWGFLVTPTLLLGLAFLPAVLRDIISTLHTSRGRLPHDVSTAA